MAVVSVIYKNGKIEILRVDACVGSTHQNLLKLAAQHIKEVSALPAAENKKFAICISTFWPHVDRDLMLLVDDYVKNNANFLGNCHHQMEEPVSDEMIERMVIYHKNTDQLGGTLIVCGNRCYPLRWNRPEDGDVENGNLGPEAMSEVLETNMNGKFPARSACAEVRDALAICVIHLYNYRQKNILMEEDMEKLSLHDQ